MKINRITGTVTLFLAAGAALVTTSALAQESSSHTKRPPHTTPAVPASYPLKKCVVSDEALGEHGKPVKVTTPSGKGVYLCCKDCVDDFKKDPEKYGAMVKRAQAKK